MDNKVNKAFITNLIFEGKVKLKVKVNDKPKLFYIIKILAEILAEFYGQSQVQVKVEDKGQTCKEILIIRKSQGRV